MFPHSPHDESSNSVVRDSIGRPVVGVCAPVYNEGANIAETVGGWRKHLAQTGMTFEIVLCDDASRDDTLEALGRLTAPELRVVRHAVNQGAGTALRDAIADSTAEWLILIDSDGQFALEDGLRILRSVQESSALTGIGVRQKKDRLLLVWGSRLTTWLANRIYKSHLRDFNCALRVVHGEECRAMRLRTTRLNYGMEITSRSLLMGLPVVEVPVGHRAREAGHGSARPLADGWSRLMFLRYLRLELKLIRAGVLDLGGVPVATISSSRADGECGEDASEIR